ARWGRVASADLSANRAYGQDLARGCAQNNIPVSRQHEAALQARQVEQQRAKEEQDRKQAEDAQRARAEEEAKRAELTKVVAKAEPSAPQQTTSIDFTAEAKKSAKILGCNSDDVRVVGIDGQNILFAATCPNGQNIALTCDPTGLCLRKQ